VVPNLRKNSGNAIPRKGKGPITGQARKKGHEKKKITRNALTKGRGHGETRLHHERGLKRIPNVRGTPLAGQKKRWENSESNIRKGDFSEEKGRETLSGNGLEGGGSNSFYKGRVSFAKKGAKKGVHTRCVKIYNAVQRDQVHRGWRGGRLAAEATRSHRLAQKVMPSPST